MLKRVLISALVAAYLFSDFVETDFPMISAVCLLALIMVSQTVWTKEYFWTAGFLTVAAIASPFALVIRLFFLMGLAGILALVTLLVAFHMPRWSLIEGPKKEGIPCHSDSTF